jgi:C4-dicarboxylate transporter DctM subunit
MEGLLTLAIMITMILISIPVAFAMIATSILVYVLVAHIPLGVVVQNMFFNMQSYSYSAVPYFILAGNVMAQGKTAPQMLEIAEAFVGFIPSGMAIAMVVACALFGTITGSDLATLAAIGGVMYPALVARGWPREFVAGILGPSALLGMLIPPTIPGLIYALVTEVSVLKVFLSGVLPGIIIVILFAIYIYYKGMKFFPDQKFQRPDFLRMVRALKDGMPALGLPAIIFGGVYGGIFTVTESAAVAAGYALFVELVIHRGIKWQDLPAIVIDTGVTTSIVLFLCAGAMVLARFLTLEQIPQMWAEQIFGLVQNKWVFIILINLFLFVTGCLVDCLSAIVILMPIFKPLYIKFGLNEIYFAGIFLLNMYIGYLTPPVGINIFYVSTVFKVSFVDCCKAYIPYILLMIIALVLVVLFPPLSTWLPNLFSR